MSFSSASGAGKISTSSDVALSNPANGEILAYNSAQQKWKNAAAPDSLYINVKDYGATGNGSTDDTNAITSARDALLALKKSSPYAYSIPLTLYFPAGVYLVTDADALMFSPTSGTAQPLYGLHITGSGKRSSRIVFSSPQGATSDPRQGNLMTLANRVRGLRVSKLSFTSTNANQSFCYMWCSQSNDGTYPEFGSGAQNDIIWDDIALTGSWKRGWGFDGDTAANQNSEQTWINCYASNDATFSDAMIRSGFTPYAAQQDQFLNYSFYHCQFEYKSGDFFVAEMGGYINVYGGSFINGINSTTDGGTWFKMGNRGHAYNVKHLNVINTRFEFRNVNCRLIDTYWSGSATHIQFTNITMATDVVPSGSKADHQTAIFRSGGGAQGFVKFENCELAGCQMFSYSSDTPANQGRAVYELCNFRDYPSGVSLAASGSFLRYSDGVPKYRITDCYGAANAAN